MCSPLLICMTSIASRCANTDQCSLFGHIPLLAIRQKKDVGTVLSLIPHPKALALPDIAERATPIAHADMNIASPYT